MTDIYDDLDGEISASEVIASLQKRIEELLALIDELPDEDYVSDLRYTIKNLEAKLADRHERMDKLHKRNADLLDAWEDMDLTKELKSRIKELQTTLDEKDKYIKEAINNLLLIKPDGTNQIHYVLCDLTNSLKHGLENDDAKIKKP